MPNDLRFAPEWLKSQPAWMKLAALVVFGLIFLCAAFLTVQDYQTSRLGYLLLPTQKLDPDTTAALVGLLPQALQVAFVWLAATKPKARNLSMLLWFVAFLPDFATDLYFKQQTLQWSGELLPDLGMGLVSWAETLLLYTLGSELMLGFAWANLSPLIAPTIGGTLGGLVRHVREAVREAARQAAAESGALFNMPEPGSNGTAKKAAAAERASAGRR